MKVMHFALRPQVTGFKLGQLDAEKKYRLTTNAMIEIPYKFTKS